MSNSIATELMPRIIGNSREYLRRKATWLPVLNHDFSDAAGKIGQRVQVPIPADMSSIDLTAGQLPPVGVDKSFAVTELVLDKARQSQMFTIEQIHLQNYMLSGPGSVLQQQINAAIDTVINDIATNLFSKYIEIPTFVGAGGTGIFASNINALADVHYAMNTQRVPDDRPKYGILSFEDWAALQKISEVRQAYSIGTAEVIQNNKWPSILGLGLKADYSITSHTVGTITTGLIAKAATAQALGLSTIVGTTAASTGACALKAGDIIKIGTGATARQYSLQADATQATAATDVSLVLDRGLEVALVGSEAVVLQTNFGSGRVNLFGDMMGVSVVTRVPENPVNVAEFPVKLQGEHFPITDPVSGVTVLLSFFGQFFQRSMCVSLVYGTKITHPARLVRGLSA